MVSVRGSLSLYTIWTTACLLLAGCGGKKSPVPVPQQTFPGVESVVPNGDGTYTLKWPRTEAPGVVFSVYSRLDGAEYDFANPESRTTFFSYRTGDLRLRTTPTCFLVRAALAPGLEDSNRKELCTDGKAMGVFPGISTVSANDDGTYLLAWTPLNFTDIEYAVFVSKGSNLSQFDFSSPDAIVAGGMFKTPLFSLGERHCFVVRYIGSALPPDTNTNALCTEETPPADFAGIDAQSSRPLDPVSAPGFFRLVWTCSSNPNVVGYNVFRGTGFSASEIIETVGKDTCSYIADTPLPGQSYYFGVRAFDAQGREDTNQVLAGPFTYTSALPPSFAGLKNATVTGDEVTLSWSPASGSPTHYLVYMGAMEWTPEWESLAADQRPNPAIDYDHPIQKITAPATSFTARCFNYASGTGATATTRNTCIGDRMVYAFAVRASVGNLEEYNTKSKTLFTGDLGAPRFSGPTLARENGAIKVSWSRPLGQTSGYEIRVWPEGSAAPAGDCETRLGARNQTATPGVTCLFAGRCSSAFIVDAADYNEFLEMKGVVGDTLANKEANAVLCTDGRPAIVKASLAGHADFRVAVNAIDGECLWPGSTTSCHRDDNSVQGTLTGLGVARPLLTLRGNASTNPLSGRGRVTDNQLAIAIHDTNDAELPQPVGDDPEPIPGFGDISEWKTYAKECMDLNFEDNTCRGWGNWFFVGSTTTLKGPHIVPPGSSESSLKAATQYCLALRAVKDGLESKAMAPFGSIPTDACPFILGNTRIPERPRFDGIASARVDPAFEKRIYVSWPKVGPEENLSQFKVYSSADLAKLGTFLLTCKLQTSGDWADGSCTLPPEVAEWGSFDGTTICSADSESCEAHIDFESSISQQKIFLAVRGFTPSDIPEENKSHDVNTTKLAFTVPNTDPPDFKYDITTQVQANEIDPKKSDVVVTWTVQTAPGPDPAKPAPHAILVYAQPVGVDATCTGSHTPDRATEHLRITVPAANGNSVRLQDLPDYQAYLIHVAGRSVYGYSQAASATPCVFLDDFTAPREPDAPTPSMVIGATRKIQLHWDAVTDAAGGSGVQKYRIYWRRAGSGEAFPAAGRGSPLPASKAVEVTAGAACSGTDCLWETSDFKTDANPAGAFEDNQGYEFLVRAIDNAGNESGNTTPSDTLTVHLTEPPLTFAGAATTTLHVTPGVGTATLAATVTWNPVADASGYLVYLGACDTGTLLPPGSRAANAVTATAGPDKSNFRTDPAATPLSERSTHSFCVRAYRKIPAGWDKNGNSNLSDDFDFIFDSNAVAQNVTTLDYTSPTAPGAPVLGIDHTNQKITASWAAATDASGIKEYRVFVKPASGSFDFASPVVTVTAPTTSASFGPTALQQGIAYDVLVRAVDDSSNANVSTNTSPASTITFRTQNVPKITTRPVVTPANPKTGDTITCTVAYTDDDSDAVTPTFLFRNVSQGNAARHTVTAPAGTTSAVYQLKSFSAASGVRANADVRGDDIRCEVTLADEQGGADAMPAQRISDSISVSNSAPGLSLGSNATQVALTGQSLDGISAFLIDPDGDALSLEKLGDDCSLFPASFTLTASSGTASGTISGTTPAGWTWEAAPTLVHGCTASFRARDMASAVSSAATVSISVRNQPPGAFGASITPANPDTDQTLTCTRTNPIDPEGDALVYSFEWRQGATFASSTALSPAETGATLAPGKTVVGTTYWCVVIASDSRSSGGVQNTSTATAQMTIANRNPNTPAAPNLAPNPVGDGVLNAGETARCTGAAVSDPDGADHATLTTTYDFLLETSPGSGVFMVAQSGAAQDITISAAWARQKIKCATRVADTHGGTAISADSSPLVIGNSAPVLAPLGPFSRAPGGALAAGDARLAATDADGDPVTYQKTSDSCGVFSIVVDGSGNHELRGTLPGAATVQASPHGSVCTIKAKAFDGVSLSNEITVTINVTNQAPLLNCSGATLDEGRTTSASLCTASDPDVGTSLTLSFTSDGCGLAARTTFTGTALNLSSPFTMPASDCTTTVRVTDNAGGENTASILFSLPGAKSITLAWGAAPALDDRCDLTLPATATFNATTFASVQGYLVPNTTPVGSCRSGDYPPVTAYPLGFAWSAPQLGATCQGASGCYVPTFTDTVNGFHSCVRVTAADGSSYMLARDLKPSSAAASALRARAPEASYRNDAMPGRQPPFQGCLGSRAGFDDEQSGRPCTGLKGMVAAGEGLSCTLVSQAASPNVGRLSCWGENSQKQLGRAVASPATSGGEPSLEGGFADGEINIVAVALGGRHTCVLRSIETASPTQGQVRCFGANDRGQAGDGLGGSWLQGGLAEDDIRQLAVAPYAFDPFLAGGIVALAAGANHTCALSASGEVRCFGENTKGQLGNGVHDPNTGDSVHVGSATPVVALAAGAIAVAAGNDHSCAILSDKTVKCWGDNATGQLGDGSNADRDVPTAVSSLTNVVALAAGRAHTCALLGDGTVSCWGAGTLGQLGNQASADAPTAQPVRLGGGAPLANVVAISAGGNTSCALLANGKVSCWGENAKGQVGDRSTVARNVATPVQLPGPTELAGVVGIDVGSDHACALLATGSVKCWGGNGSGQLGLGSTNGSSNSPGGDATVGAGLSPLRRACSRYTVAP